MLNKEKIIWRKWVHSYGNLASIELYGISITPELLMQLANELERVKLRAEIEAK